MFILNVLMDKSGTPSAFFGLSVSPPNAVDVRKGRGGGETTEDRNHGRVESDVESDAESDAEWLEQRDEWSDLQSQQIEKFPPDTVL
jgi:hypothetical protein